jgi:hypothetical protein
MRLLWVFVQMDIVLDPAGFIAPHRREGIWFTKRTIEAAVVHALELRHCNDRSVARPSNGLVSIPCENEPDTYLRLANTIGTAIRVRVGVGAFASTDNWNLIRRQFPHDSVSLHTADQALMFL